MVYFSRMIVYVQQQQNGKRTVRVPNKAAAGNPTLPEGEEDDRLDHKELEHGAVGDQQLTGGKVEEEEGIEGQADRDIVDDGHVEVATGHTADGRERGTSKGAFKIPWVTDQFEM